MTEAQRLERQRANVRRWQAEHPGWWRKYAVKNVERAREWERRNPEKHRAQLDRALARYRLRNRRALVENPRRCLECEQPLGVTDPRSRLLFHHTCWNARARRSEAYDRAQAQRRARASGAFVGRVVRRTIYERDGWRCHLCGRPTCKVVQVPHPLAPTLDHILPLARGGTHEPGNVATAHWFCNKRKGARVAKAA